MPTDLKTLRQRLQQEKEHLAWFLESGQPMTSSGEDMSAAYQSGVEDRIASLEKQITDVQSDEA